MQAFRKQYGLRYVPVTASNRYWPHNNYHPQYYHVLPALLRRFHDAMEQNASYVTLWGTGRPRREFLYSDDMADAAITVLSKHEGNEIVKIGCGEDLTILELASKVACTGGYEGRIELDPSKPDGTFRKVLDVSRVKSLGRSPKVTLDEGLKLTYHAMLSEIADGTGRDGANPEPAAKRQKRRGSRQ